MSKWQIDQAPSPHSVSGPAWVVTLSHPTPLKSSFTNTLRDPYRFLILKQQTLKSLSWSVELYYDCGENECKIVMDVVLKFAIQMASKLKIWLLSASIIVRSNRVRIMFASFFVIFGTFQAWNISFTTDYKLLRCRLKFIHLKNTGDGIIIPLFFLRIWRYDLNSLLMTKSFVSRSGTKSALSHQLRTRRTIHKL